MWLLERTEWLRLTTSRIISKCIKESDIILTQLEIPIETITYLASLSENINIPMILNPAPYQPLPASVVEAFRYITPNETEAELFKKELEEGMEGEQWITTKGKEGVLIYKQGQELKIPGYSVNVEDTTGAGDTFNGALAVYLARGYPLEDAVRISNAAAALSVTQQGAQSGMPTQQAVEQFMKESK